MNVYDSIISMIAKLKSQIYIFISETCPIFNHFNLEIKKHINFEKIPLEAFST